MTTIKITKPTDPGTDHRFLTDTEKDGRYSDHRAEYWSVENQCWIKSNNASALHLVYRVRTTVHNPKNLECDKGYQFLNFDELDGRWNGVAEELSSLGTWEVAIKATSLNTTYRIALAPNSIGPEIGQHHRKLEDHEIDGRYAGIAEYWNTSTSEWLPTTAASNKNYIYRVSTRDHNPDGVYAVDLLDTHRLLRVEELDGRWNGKALVYSRSTRTWVMASGLIRDKRNTYMVKKEAKPGQGKNNSSELVFPTIPVKFLDRHVHYDEIAVALALYASSDIPRILKHWNLRSIPSTAYYVYSVEPLVMTRPAESPDYKIISRDKAATYPPSLIEYYGVGLSPMGWTKITNQPVILRGKTQIEEVFKPTYYYRVSLGVHNPENWQENLLEPGCRFLKVFELDGRWNGKSRVYYPSSRKWDSMEKTDRARWTYAIPIPDEEKLRKDPNFVELTADQASKYPPSLIQSWHGGSWVKFLDTPRGKTSYTVNVPSSVSPYVANEQYRVATFSRNPEGVSWELLGSDSDYRLLREDEYDGRWVNKAETYLTRQSRWTVMANSDFSARHTYRLSLTYDSSVQSVNKSAASPAPKSSPKTAHEFVAELKTKLPAIFEQSTLYNALDSLTAEEKVNVFSSLVYLSHIERIPTSELYRWSQSKEIQEKTPREKLPALFTYEQGTQVLGHYNFVLEQQNSKIKQVPGMDLYQYAD